VEIMGEVTAAPCVDVHTHVVPSRWPGGTSGGLGGFRIEPDRDREGFLQVTRDGRTLRSVGPEGWDPASRLAAMDRSGVGTHVLSPTPFTYLHDAPPAVAAEVCRFQNESLVEFRRADPDRLLAFGVLPLQDPAAAVDEARFIAEAGLHGVAIGTDVGGVPLGDQRFFEVYEAVSALGLAVFVHPHEGAVTPALDEVGLGFGCAYPLSTAAAAAHLLWSGVLDRYPDLRICLAHGGGALPSLVGRLSTGWERLPGRAGRLRRHPREALAQFWTDSLTYDAEVLRLVLSVVGETRVVLGTDFPFAAMEQPAGQVLREAEAAGIISPAARARILTENVEALLGRPLAGSVREPQQRPASAPSPR
jgi:aminocarboxymuconate-semialdehyde decarboxylase